MDIGKHCDNVKVIKANTASLCLAFVVFFQGMCPEGSTRGIFSAAQIGCFYIHFQLLLFNWVPLIRISIMARLIIVE